jgi:hypothetical protein
MAVDGDASVGGDLAVAGSSQVTGDAGVTGNLLAGTTRTGALDVDGPVTIGTSLMVQQWAELAGGAVIDGAFSATGNALMADVTVGGTLDAAGSAVLPVVQLGQVSPYGGSHVAMLAGAVAVPVGPKFVAPTDGFVLGTVLGGQGAGRVWAVLSAQTATGTLAQCSGGTVTWTEGLKTSFSPMSNTLLLPVASGDLFWVTVDVTYGEPTCLVWWLGIGSGGLGPNAADTGQHE